MEGLLSTGLTPLVPTVQTPGGESLCEFLRLFYIVAGIKLAEKYKLNSLFRYRAEQFEIGR